MIKAFLGAVGVTAALSVTPMVSQCAPPEPPNISCNMLNTTTYPDHGMCGVYGNPGYVFVTAYCSDEDRSVINPNPAIDVIVDSEWMRFEGGGDSFHRTYFRKFCPYSYPYIQKVGGGSSAV